VTLKLISQIKDKTLTFILATNLDCHIFGNFAINLLRSW